MNPSVKNTGIAREIRNTTATMLPGFAILESAALGAILSSAPFGPDDATSVASSDFTLAYDTIGCLRLGRQSGGSSSSMSCLKMPDVHTRYNT